VWSITKQLVKLLKIIKNNNKSRIKQQKIILVFFSFYKNLRNVGSDIPNNYSRYWIYVMLST